jgi:hypothetical protein
MNTQVLTGKAIDRFRLLSLRSMISMEIRGMKGRGNPTAVIIKELTGETVKATMKQKKRAIELINAELAK